MMFVKLTIFAFTVFLVLDDTRTSPSKISDSQTIEHRIFDGMTDLTRKEIKAHLSPAAQQELLHAFNQKDAEIREYKEMLVDVDTQNPHIRESLLEEVRDIRRNFKKIPPMEEDLQTKCAVYWADISTHNDAGVAFKGVHMVLFRKFQKSVNKFSLNQILVHTYPFSSAPDHFIPPTQHIEFRPGDDKDFIYRHNMYLSKRTFLYNSPLRIDSRKVLVKAGMVGSLRTDICDYVMKNFSTKT